MKTLCTLAGILCLFQTMTAQLEWTSTGGPEGIGNCSSYSNQNHAFAYDGLNLYRLDSDLRWRNVRQNSTGLVFVSDSILALYNEIYIDIDNSKEVQLLISKDQGESWEEVSVPAGANDPFPSLNRIMLASHGLYFQAGAKLYKSQTQGQSWKIVSYDSIPINSVFVAEDRIFGKDGDKIYEFFPQTGKWVFSWTAPKAGINGDVYIHEDNIIVGGNKLFYVSSNRGLKWKTFSTINSNINFIKKDNKVYYQSGKTLRYSENEGQIWKNITLDGSYEHNCIYQNKFLLFSIEKGVFLYDESENSYINATTGLNSSPVMKLVAGGNQVWAQDQRKQLHIYNTEKKTWSLSNLPIIHEFHYDLSINESGEILHFNRQTKTISISIDAGEQWDTLASSSLPNSLIYIEKVCWVGNKILIVSDESMWFSADKGNSWTRSVGVYSPVYFNNKIWAINISGNIITSSDNGQSWQEHHVLIGRIGKIFTAGDHIFIRKTSPYHLYTSTDGDDWQFASDLISNNSQGFLDEVHSIWSFENQYYLLFKRSGIIGSDHSFERWEPVENLSSYLPQGVIEGIIYTGSPSGGGIVKATLPRFSKALIAGHIYHDQNKNGIKDPDETYLPDMKIAGKRVGFSEESYFANSNLEGYFEIIVHEDNNDTIRPFINSPYVDRIEPAYYIAGENQGNYDFAISFIPNITDAAISGTFNKEPKLQAPLSAHLYYENKGTLPLSGTVGLKLDKGFNYYQAVPPPSEIIGTDSLVWHFSDLPVGSKAEIVVEGSLDNLIFIWETMNISAHISANNEDMDLSNNDFLIQDSVVIDNFISNRKKVLPKEGITLEEMQEGKELVYTIYFQNPINEIVQNIQISDHLPPQLDFNSVRIIGSSHSIAKWEVLPSGLLRVFYEQLNLAPHQIGSEASQGFFSFAIIVRKDNPSMFSFQNIAHIIFDHVFSVSTNPALTNRIEKQTSKITEELLTFPAKLIISPNPASRDCTIRTNALLSGSGIIKMYALSGQLIRKQPVSDLSQDTNIDLENLSPGVYFIVAEGKEGNMRGKLIVQE